MSDIFERIDAEIDSALNEGLFKKKMVTLAIPGRDANGNLTKNIEEIPEKDARKQYPDLFPNNKKAKNKKSTNESYSDAELLNFLEENNFETSYSNLCILKEGLANGTIVLEAKQAEEAVPEEEIEAAPEAKQTEEVAEETPIEGEDAMSRVTVSIPIDGSMQIDARGKTVVADPEGNVQCSITESHYFLNNTNAERLLKSYLIEDCGMSIKEYSTLTEDTKNVTVKEIASMLFSNIQGKLESVDTSLADRSRGDIKQFVQIIPIQDAISKLESIIERDENARPEYSTAINTIIKSILYINQYSQVFKDAYRNKKTVMILKYQSLILSIISSVSYLIASIIDFSNGEVKLKTTAQEIQEFAPLQSLAAFNKSVDGGEFKILTRDTDALREYYLEVPVETMSKILEAYEYVPMIVDGIKNIYSKLNDSNGANKMVGYLYKAVGVLVLLFSLRDVIYTLFRMKNKVSDMATLISNFTNMNNGGNILNKISQFINKFKSDAEYGSDMSHREIEDENRRTFNQVRSIQATPVITQPEAPVDTTVGNANIPMGSQEPINN